jgi:signal transduction histidine kinase
LKPLRSIFAIVAALAVILGLSVASALREERRLTDDFSAATRQQVHASVEALSARLDALDQDTRMLVDLVRSTEGERGDPTAQRQVWASTFRALAIGVPQYRLIAMVDTAGTVEVIAVDPTESEDAISALDPHVREFARAVATRGAKALGQTVRYGSRSFLLYGTPVGPERAIVVASDAAIFLGAVAWTPLSAARLFVTDPAGVVWAGCETPRGCHETRDEDAHVDRPSVPQRARGGRIPVVRIPEISVAETIDQPTGSWIVTWVASTRDILERQRSMIARVVLTAIAAAFAVAVVGAVLLQQQRAAAELAARLHIAQALAGARETSQAVVESAPLGVLGLSREGRVVFANRFLTDRVGPVQTGVSLEEAFAPALLPWVRELEPLLRSSQRDGALRHGVLRSIATGTHEFRVRVVPVRSDDLGVRIFALLEDQSAVRDLEQQLVRAEKLITVGVLAAGIAHEIGSPLAVIRGRAEQVLRTVGEGPRAEDLRVIIKHIDRIASTLRQVLDFSRRQPIERVSVALDSVLEQARNLLQWKLEAKGVHIDVRLDAGLPALAADPDQLQQVLVNVLLNACDASAEGQHVMVRARRSRSGMVDIEVADAGCGIAPEHMNAVFDPFFTTKKRGEGTGLGLSIASSIVRNHGGEIDLTSTPGKGTTVKLTWPTAAQPRRIAGAHA